MKSWWNKWWTIHNWYSKSSKKKMAETSDEDGGWENDWKDISERSKETSNEMTQGVKEDLRKMWISGKKQQIYN